MESSGRGIPVRWSNASDGGRFYRGGNSRLLWYAVGSGDDRQAAAVNRESWELEGRAPSRPLRWARTVPGREFPTSVVRGQDGGGNSNFRENMMLEGAGGPDSLQTSPPVRRRNRAASFSACGPPGLTLPGNARQLLNRRSGSARLRSTASQLLLAALRNAKQSSHMRSRR